MRVRARVYRSWGDHDDDDEQQETSTETRWQEGQTLWLPKRQPAQPTAASDMLTLLSIKPMTVPHSIWPNEIRPVLRMEDSGNKSQTKNDKTGLLEQKTKGLGTNNSPRQRHMASVFRFKKMDFTLRLPHELFAHIPVESHRRADQLIK